MAPKFQLLFLFLYFCLIWSFSLASSDEQDDYMTRRFEAWMAQHGRVYSNADEKSLRFQIFKDNVNHIETFNNRSGNSYTLGINQFVDMAIDEFAGRYTGLSTPQNIESEPVWSLDEVNVSVLPRKIDWRKRGAVTGVKQQGECGSCWAFAAVATVEGLYQIKTGNLLLLSEQEVLDCSVSDECIGGWVQNGYKFIIANNGVAAGTDYPYVGVKNTCAANGVPNSAYITGYKFLPWKRERAIMIAVSQQPVAAAVDMRNKNFQFYQSGIFRGPCGVRVNHAITIVGYGENNLGEKHWIIKNSWGSEWGENGYMRLQRGITAASGRCGIAMYVVRPTLRSMPATELFDVGSDISSI